jgi:hypothetical protein
MALRPAPLGPSVCLSTRWWIESEHCVVSARAVWLTDCHIDDRHADGLSPIGPRKLFTAFVHPATQEKLRARRPRDLVKAVNKLIVQHAMKYDYGVDDLMLPFVQKHMSTKRHSTLLERLAARHGHDIIAVGQSSRQEMTRWGCATGSKN